MIKLLLDMGLPRRTADDLVNLGWDAVHIATIASPTSSDFFILQLAREDNRVVVSLDSDFAQLISLNDLVAPSVVYIRIQMLDRMAATALLSKVLPVLSPDLESGCIATVTPHGIRIRMLPLS